MKLIPTGIRATPLYLTVEAQLPLGEVHRLVHVKVPLHWLLSDQITSALDARVRRDLIEHWSEVDLADPLF